MATATSLTAERMLEIERASVVSARRENGELILTTRGGTDINVGDVTGTQGPPGPDGATRYTWLKYADSPTTGMTNDPTGKNYIGIAYNKTVPIESNVYADYYWTLIRGPEGQQGVPGPPGPNGEPTFVWIKYATDINGAGLSDNPTNRDYIGFAYNKSTAVESTNPADYTWSLIKGPKGNDGIDGADGLPGPPGSDGAPSYTWLKYATTPTTGMSDDPTGKDYIGLAYNKGTSTESTTYSDYAWSLIKGPQGNQGVPGTPGADGTPRYVWIKYAGDITGAGMSDDPTGKDYIGLAYNKTTAIESTEPLDYTWSLYKGEPGADGDDGRGITASEITYQASWSGVLVPTGTWLTDPPALSAGQYLWTRTKTSYSATPFEVMSYSVGQMGQTGPGGADGTTITAAVVRYQLHSNGITPPIGTWLSSPPAGSPGQWFWTRTTTSYSQGTDTVAYSVSLLGATGAPGNDGAPGTDGRGITSSAITYQASSSGTVVPVGTWFSSPPAVSSGQFLWTRTITTYTDSSTSTSYSIGQMGAQGAQGNQGIQGPAGTNYYTWLKYADSPTTGMSDSPTGKTYIGLAFNQTSATESSIYADYSWSLIQGTQGIQGPPGTNGTPTYTWIKYGTSNTGAGISDDPTGKTYIGIAYNKSTIVESTTTTDYEWSLIQGAAGAPGESVTGQTVTYQLSASGTVIPTGTWLGSPPSGSPSQYMWTRIAFTYSTLPVSYAYSVALFGATGSAGANAAVINMIATSQVLRSPAIGGVTTPATVTITGTATNTTISVWEYAVDGGVFSASVPAGVSRTGNVVTITGSTMAVVTIAVRMADANGIAQSVTVAKIYDGAIGPAGNTGRGISSTDITYQSGSSGTSVPVGTWVTNPPAVSPGQYLWTRTILNYSSGSPTSTTYYSVGSTGSTIDTVTVAYQLANSGTVTPNGAWLSSPPDQTDALPFLWTRTVTTYLGGPTTSTAYSISRRGIGVVSVETVYKAITPLYSNGFETQALTATEIYRNKTLNPRQTEDGSTVEMGVRWGWSKTYVVDSVNPLGDFETFIRALRTVNGTDGTTRGIDWYSNMDIATYPTTLAVTAGQTIRIRYLARVSKTVVNMETLVRIHNGVSWLTTGTVINTVLNPAVNTPIVMETDWVVPNTGYLSVRNSINNTGMSWGATDYLDQSGLYIGNVTEYFDGIETSDSDLVPSWTGAENASQSILSGYYITNVGIGGGSPIRSTQWFKAGHSSLRVLDNGANNDSGAWVAGSSAINSLSGLGMTFQAGSTYTIIGTIRLTAAQTGTLSSDARNIQVIYNSVSGWTGATGVRSTAAPNAAGTYGCSVTFTLPANAVGIGVRLRNGAGYGGGDVWWDDFSIISGDIATDIASWGTKLPGYNSVAALFRSEKVVFTDGSITYSTPQLEPLWDTLATALEARNNAENALVILNDHSLTIYGADDGSGLTSRLYLLEHDTSENPATPLGALIKSIGKTANGKNIVVRSLDDAINPGDYIAGDQWYQHDTSKQIKNFWIHDGDDWQLTKLNGAIFGSVDASAITSGSISAERISINTIPRDRIIGLDSALTDLGSLDGTNDVVKALTRLTSSINIADGVIKILTDESDPTNGFRMELDATELGFYENNQKVSYISDKKLVINSAEIALTSSMSNPSKIAAHEIYKGGVAAGLVGKVTIFRSI